MHPDNGVHTGTYVANLFSVDLKVYITPMDLKAGSPTYVLVLRMKENLHGTDPGPGRLANDLADWEHRVGGVTTELQNWNGRRVQRPVGYVPVQMGVASRTTPTLFQKCSIRSSTNDRTLFFLLRWAGRC